MKTRVSTSHTWQQFAYINKNLFQHRAYSFTPTKTYAHGNTWLHDFVRRGDFEGIKSEMQKIGDSQFSLFARTLNDDGLLPIRLLDNPINSLKKVKIHTMLAAHMIVNPFKKLSEPVNFSDLVDKYKPEPNSDLYNNLQLACLLVNKTRKEKLKKSPTHPELNVFPEKTMTSLNCHLERIRKESTKVENTVVKSYMNNPTLEINTQMISTFCLNDYKITVPLEVGLDFLKRSNRLFHDEEIGNCHEFAATDLQHFVEMTNGKRSGGLFHIEKGDHVVMAFGYEDINKLPQSKAGVALESWSGNIFPTYKLNTELANYWQYQHLDLMFNDLRSYNVITTFNPNYHSLSPIVTFKSEHESKLRKQDKNHLHAAGSSRLFYKPKQPRLENQLGNIIPEFTVKTLSH